MKIYTRGGDGGRTKLFGGVEVDKNDSRVDAYGTLDELNAHLGVVLALDPEDDLGTGDLVAVQEDLFVLGSRLAAARPERELARGTIPQLHTDRTAALEALGPGSSATVFWNSLGKELGDSTTIVAHVTSEIADHVANYHAGAAGGFGRGALSGRPP